MQLTELNYKCENIHNVLTAKTNRLKTKQMEPQEKYRLGTISNYTITRGGGGLNAPNLVWKATIKSGLSFGEIVDGIFPSVFR